jgi:hypothetical protein
MNNDGRKYDIGDKVTFTSDEGKQVPGVVHGVRYQAGRWELVGADHEIPHDPTSPVVPGTGHMEVIKGTENEHHDFEYIIVHEHEHKAWWETEKANKKHIENKHHHKVEAHPHLTQHIRVFEQD